MIRTGELWIESVWDKKSTWATTVGHPVAASDSTLDIGMELHADVKEFGLVSECPASSTRCAGSLLQTPGGCWFWSTVPLAVLLVVRRPVAGWLQQQ